MSNPVATLQSLAELHREAREEQVLEDMTTIKDDSFADLFVEMHDESEGFRFLAEHGARAVQAFKLLEIAHSEIGGERGTGELTSSEWSLLMQMLGSDFMEGAADAYDDCKARTRELEEMHNLDSRAVWRLTELVHLFEHIMLYGIRGGRLTRGQGPRVLTLLVRDYGEYFGLLCDDVADSTPGASARLAQYLAKFKVSELFNEKLPVDKMTRLALSDPLAKDLLDYEISRAIAGHPLAIKERILRGDESGHLDESNPVTFVTHKLDVRYAAELSDSDLGIVSAILPLLAISVFEGFSNLPEVEAYITKRTEEIRLEEQQCFALLQCLEHYAGKIPSRMKEFEAEAVMKAAKAMARQKAKQRFEKKKSTTLTGMLKERVSGAFGALASPLTITWPEDRQIYNLPGYPSDIGFFVQHVSVDEGNGEERYTFLCHTHTQKDPRGDRPLMFEYQVVIDEGTLFDAYSACLNGFADAPETFKRTLAVGPEVTFAKETQNPGEQGASVDMEEVKLLAAFAALKGGMKSWLGQHYVLSDSAADIFKKYPDVKEYAAALKRRRAPQP